MKNYLTFLVILTCGIFTNTIFAATCTTTAPGVWDCGTPTEDDDLIVNHSSTVSNFDFTGTVTINSGATLTVTGDSEPDDATIVINSGGTLSIGDDFRLRGTTVVTVNSGATLDVTTNSNGDLELFNSASLIISGTVSTSDDFELFGSSTVTMNNGADVDVGDDLLINSNGNLTINSGATVDIFDDFEILSDDVVIDGLVNVGEDFENDGDITGSGVINHTGDCTNGDGNGSINGVDEADYCDGSTDSTIGLGTLPVDLLYFNAEIVKSESVLLNWATASEENFDYFTIEKSADGQNFEIVDKLDGAGNSSQILQYSFVDDSPLSGTSFYRLKSTDYDGTFEYFDIISVNLGRSGNNYMIYPNPSDGEAIKVLGTVENQKLSIYDLKGNLAYRGEIDTGVNSIEFSKALGQGVYLVKITGAGQTNTSKLIVK